MCIPPPPANNVSTLEAIFMELGVYIMAYDPISTTYFINAYHQ
jgi:hypothetical protein